MQNRYALEGLICSDRQKQVFSETFIALPPHDSNQIVVLAVQIDENRGFSAGISVLQVCDPRWRFSALLVSFENVAGLARVQGRYRSASPKSGDIGYGPMLANSRALAVRPKSGDSGYVVFALIYY